MKSSQKPPSFPSLDEVLLLHKRLIDKFGGIHGVKDFGLLESSLFRPQSGYYETYLHQVSALMHSLINNHCFLDGNKRIGFTLVAVCLRMNGFDLELDPDEAEKFIVDKIIKAKVGVEEIADFINSHLRAI